MTDKIPKQLDDRNAWSVSDFIKYAETGEPPENRAYAKTRNNALEAAGLEPDQVEPVPLDEMSTAEHIKRMATPKRREL